MCYCSCNKVAVIVAFQVVSSAVLQCHSDVVLGLCDPNTLHQCTFHMSVCTYISYRETLPLRVLVRVG